MVHIFITILLLLFFTTSVLFLGLEVTIRCRILKSFPVLDTLIISLGFGFGVLALVTFSLGILHLLYLYVIIVVVIPLILLNFSKKINFLTSINIKNYFVNLKSQKGFYKILILLLLLYILVNFLRALVPVTDHDSLEAYLYIPKLFVESHSITKLSFTKWDDLPLNVEMITTLALLIKDGVFAQVITGWTFGVLAMLAIFIISKQLVNTQVGIIAAVLFYTIPEVLWLTSTTKIDLGWVFWEYLAFYLFMYWFKNNEKSTDYKILYFSFLFLGFSLGTKYLTLVSLILYSLILTFILIKINKIPLLKTITIVCIANSLAFSIALPYFTKNIAYTHNPVFPFIFSENVSYGYNGISYEGISGLLNYYWNLFFGRDFLFKPMFYKGATSFGFLIIAFLPSFLLDKKNRITLGYFLIIWFIYSIIMFFISDPQPRHFLNSIPLLIIPGAAGMYSLFVQKNIFRICFFGIFILSVFIDLRERTNIFIFSQSRVVFGKESQDAYLERYLFSHPEHLNSDMMIFIKNNLDKDSKILTLYFCNAFYVDRIMTTDYNLENKFIYHEKNIGKFLGKLGELGITHVYLSDSDYMRREDLWKKTFAETLILNDDFKNTYLELVFSSCDQHLFRINYTP